MTDPVSPRQPLVLPPNGRDVTAERVGTVTVIVRAPKPPYVLPPNSRDVTHEKAGTIFAIVGATAPRLGAPKDKPK
jgi:hypothetical protein